MCHHGVTRILPKRGRPPTICVALYLLRSLALRYQPLPREVYTKHQPLVRPTVVFLQFMVYRTVCCAMPNVGLDRSGINVGLTHPLLDFLVFGGTWCENRPRLEQPCHFSIGWFLYLNLVGRCFDFTASDAKAGSFVAVVRAGHKLHGGAMCAFVRDAEK